MIRYPSFASSCLIISWILEIKLVLVVFFFKLVGSGGKCMYKIGQNSYVIDVMYKKYEVGG